MPWVAHVFQYLNQPESGSKPNAIEAPWFVPEIVAAVRIAESPAVAGTVVACAVAPEGLATWGGGENWGSLTAPAEVAA